MPGIGLGVGLAASVAAGLRAVGLLPVATPATPPPPAAPPPPGTTPLPAGIVARWDAASLAEMVDGAALTRWTDGVAGITAVSTGGGVPLTYAADSGGLHRCARTAATWSPPQGPTPPKGR